MNRAVLEACLPLVGMLLVVAALMWLTVRLSGARVDWRRLARLHRCQDGGVQSLALVLTLPIFIVLFLLILQISQLMIGIMGVHYAAYAGARSAVVWLPAETVDSGFLYESANQIGGTVAEHADGVFVLYPSPDSDKYQRIRTAAVLAVAPFGPSRDLDLSPGDASGWTQNAAFSTKNIYHSLNPQATDPRIDARIDNKLVWADLNTEVILEWRDARRGEGRNTLVGPTYNPRYHPDAYNPDNPAATWRINEVGWQDPVTVYVVHRMALLPGPGRWLSFPDLLNWERSLPPWIQQAISPQFLEPSGEDGTPAVLIPAAATMVNEGLIPTFRYSHERF